MSASPRPLFITDSVNEQVYEDCMLVTALGPSASDFLTIDGVTFESDVLNDAHMNLGFADDLSSTGFPAFHSSGEMGIPSGGHPIDIPGYVEHSHLNVPLTPPDSDPPDSPPGLNTLSVSGTSSAVHRMAAIRDPFEPMSKRLRPNTHFLPTVKTEPGISDEFNMDTMCSPTATNAPSTVDMDSSYQCLKFCPFKPNEWHDLYDESQYKKINLEYRVDADKGFNFSMHDDAFVCQKKNHFQVTTHIEIDSKPKYVQTKDGLKPIEKLKLHLYGVKKESPSTKIRIEQSQADRSKKSYEPASIRISVNEPMKETVGRMHFSETTSNNMRKKGKPNPDQRYFLLVVAVHAHTKSGDFPVCAHASEKIIVRASNPGQFENDMDAIWLRAHAMDSIYRNGSVGINTDKPDESLCVNGNVKVSGRVIHPSDQRVKENIQEVDSSEQLHNVVNMKIYKYQYIREYLEHTGLDGEPCAEGDTGVLAQEVKEVLPEAVKVSNHVVLKDGTTIENFLLVDKDRIFMENVGAVKELCKVTDKLQDRIGELEVINQKLQKRRCDTATSIQSFTRTSSVRSSVRSCKKVPLSHHDASASPCPHRHHCCQHGRDQRHCCRQNTEAVAVVEPGICTPKFMQIVIVLLILVMILCIAALATVYLTVLPETSNAPPSTASPKFNSNKVTASNFISTSSSRSSNSIPTTPCHPGSTVVSAVTLKSQPMGSTVASSAGPGSTAADSEVTVSSDSHGRLMKSVNMSEITETVTCCRKLQKSEDQNGIYDCKTSVSQQASKADGFSNNASFVIALEKSQALTLEVNSTAITLLMSCPSNPSKVKTTPTGCTSKQGEWAKCHKRMLRLQQSIYHFRVFFHTKGGQQLTCQTQNDASGKIFKDYYLKIC